MTLVEVLIGTALLVGGGGALLLGMHYTLIHSDYLSEAQVAMQAAQGELEQLSNESFAMLSLGMTYADARRLCPPGPCGQGVLVPDNPEFPRGLLGIQIKSFPPGTPFATATLLDLSVAACWTSRGRRIGEDQNCNGILDVGEDLNTNGWIDSPAMVSTRIATKS